MTSSNGLIYLTVLAYRKFNKTPVNHDNLKSNIDNLYITLRCKV